jgi:hypothetical protein
MIIELSDLHRKELLAKPETGMGGKPAYGQPEEVLKLSSCMALPARP